MIEEGQRYISEQSLSVTCIWEVDTVAIGEFWV